MFIKIHRSYRDVIALCDADLIGKKFEEKNRQLDIRENFYKGEQIEEKNVEKLLILYGKNDATFNIVGKKATAVALSTGLITKESIGYVAGIPFALIF